MSDWRQWVADKVELLPGRALLDPQGNPQGLNQKAYEQVSVPFGLAGRMVKEGLSVAVGLSHYGPEERRHLAYFIHSLHYEACQGLIAGKWVARVRSQQTRHLFVWGPNREWELCLKPAFSQLHPLHLKKATKEILRRDPDTLRTMLISRRARTDAAMEELVTILSPFCMIIDATPWGFRKDLSVDWNTLSSYFPDVPKVIIFNRGDVAVKNEIDTLPVHQVVWRYLDDPKKDKESVPAPALLVTPDPVMDFYLGNSTQMVMSAIQKSRTEDADVVRMGRGLISQMADMVSPLSEYHKALSNQKGAITYMQKTPATRLDLLRKVQTNYGAGNALKTDLIEHMESLFGKLENGKPGKIALLKKKVEDAINRDETVLVITRTEADANACMRYLLDTCSSVDVLTDKLQCMSVNKRWPVSMWGLNVDHIIVTCTLWYSDLWLMDLPHTNISWLCYPFEVPLRQKIYETLYKKAFAQSRADGDKLKIIRYQWKKKAYLRDWEVNIGEIPSCETVDVTDCRGDYKVEREGIVKRFEWDSDAAFDRMLEYDDVDNEDASKILKDSTVIHWEDNNKPLVVAPNTKLKVLKNQSDELEDTYCFDLKPGDKVILVQNDNHAVTDIFNAISDQLSIDMTISMMLRKIDKWHQLVDQMRDRFTVREIKNGLAKQGIKISEAQIRNWLQHQAFGPQTVDKVKGVATLCDSEMVKKNADGLFNAMQEYRNWRRSLGKFIKETLNDSYARDSVCIEGVTLSAEAIEELLVVKTVEEVISPPPTWAEKKASSLDSLITQIDDAFGNNIELTPKCKSSMKASPYKHTELAYKAFELMNSELYPVYTKKNRLDGAVAKLEEFAIQYRGDTSDTTKGKFSNNYQVTYEGKKYQAGKHLCLGNSRDPKYCLRIYFEWDEARGKILVFHAGRHLPTRTG